MGAFKERYLEESFLDKAKQTILQAMAIPSNILHNILNKYRVKIIEEVAVPLDKISGETDDRDTCYTGLMKLIGQERIIKKYPTLADFYKKYYEKVDKLQFLTMETLPKMKPGTILLSESENDINPKNLTGYYVNRAYGKHGIEQRYEERVGHMLIYLGKEQVKNKDSYLFLHNTGAGDDRKIGGTGLELYLDRRDGARMKSWLTKEGNAIVIIDYNIITKM